MSNPNPPLTMATTQDAESGYCRGILREELARRIQQNSSYSLRSFARSLKLPPSTLSDILSGRRKLPIDRSGEIADRIGLEGVSREVFCLWNDLEHTKSETSRATLLERIASLEPQNDTIQLQLDGFRLIADWYSFPLLELIHATPTLTVKDWAKRLELSEVLVKTTIERLLRLQLLEKNTAGLYQKTSSRNWFFSPPNESTVHDLYRTMMARASESLSKDSANERFYSTHSIVFTEEALKKVRVRLERFQEEISKLSESPKDPNSTRVFQFSVQLFPISNLIENKEVNT